MIVQSLERAFDILELLSQEQHGLTLTEIGKKLGLHKSTVYRLLAVMQKRGYIEKDTKSLAYKLGLGFIELSSRFLNNLELKTEAEPILRNLSKQTTQTVFLAILQNNKAVYIDKVEQFNSLRRYSIIGLETPLHCTSLGKALLTGMEDNEINNIYNDSVLKTFTKKTIKDIPTLLDTIASSRKRGWTIDDEEFEEGVRCVAAPIFDYRNKVIAAVSTSWEINVANNLKIEEIAEYVKDAAYEISKHMGYKKKQ